MIKRTFISWRRSRNNRLCHFLRGVRSVAHSGSTHIYVIYGCCVVLKNVINRLDIIRMAGCLPKRILRETEKLISEPVPGIDARPDEQNARCVFMWHRWFVPLFLCHSELLYMVMCHF